jgi:hypothetical protein
MTKRKPAGLESTKFMPLKHCKYGHPNYKQLKHKMPGIQPFKNQECEVCISPEKKRSMNTKEIHKMRITEKLHVDERSQLGHNYATITIAARSKKIFTKFIIH